MASGPNWWVSGRVGTLSPWATAQVWGMHTIAKKKDWKVTNEEICGAVQKVGAGKKSGGHPSIVAIAKLRKKFDNDPQ